MIYTVGSHLSIITNASGNYLVFAGTITTNFSSINAQTIFGDAHNLTNLPGSSLVGTIQSTNPVATFLQTIGSSNSPSGTVFSNNVLVVGTNAAIYVTATNLVDRTNLSNVILTMVPPTAFSSQITTPLIQGPSGSMTVSAGSGTISSGANTMTPGGFFTSAGFLSLVGLGGNGSGITNIPASAIATASNNMALASGTALITNGLIVATGTTNSQGQPTFTNATGTVSLGINLTVSAISATSISGNGSGLNNFEGTNLLSHSGAGNATSGFVPTADGAGNVTWGAQSGGGGSGAPLNGTNTWTGTNTFTLPVTVNGGFTNLNAGGVGNGDVPIVIYRSSTVVNDTGSSSASNVVSFAVPANSLGTNKSLKIVIRGDKLQNTGSVTNLTISFSYGGTVMWSTTIADAFNVARHPFTVDVDLCNANATSSQIINGFYYANSNPANPTTGEGSVSTSAALTGAYLSGTSSIDSTASQTFLMTITWASVAATAEFKVQHVTAIVQ